jgi:Protein of unknown function (DUF3102)
MTHSDAGIRLTQAKAQCQHGHWSPWLAANCPKVAERTARAYMQLARNWNVLESKTAGTADLTLDAALKLLTAPKTAKESSTQRLSPPAATGSAEIKIRAGAHLPDVQRAKTAGTAG